MEKFVVVSKSKTGCNKSNKLKQRYNPYDIKTQDNPRANARDQRKETEK